MSTVILGLSVMDDSSAALMVDGELVGAVEEERFSRRKHHTGFPFDSVRWCLETAGLGLEDVDHVGLYWRPWNLGGRVREVLRHALRPRYLKAKASRGAGLWPHWRRMFKGDRVLCEGLGYERRQTRFQWHALDHHLCHAASCYLPSPFDDAAILTLDGAGENTTTLMAHGRGDRIHVLGRRSLPHSLGQMYGAVTKFLGFRLRSGEGKVMGLASYGEPEYRDLFERILVLEPDGWFRLDTSIVDYHLAMADVWPRAFTDVVGPPREPESEITERDRNLAASLQARLEDAALHLARAAAARTGSRKLCLAGGVALNSVMNGRIQEEGDFDEIWIQPAAGDNGPPLGACALIWTDVLGRPRRWRMEDAYVGPAWDELACAMALNMRGLVYERPEDPAEAAAALLADSKIVGWMQGSMEIGPRALGHRSILADPRQPDMQDVLNSRVKFREWFRPYAPSVLEEHCSEWFATDRPSPFMLRVHDVREDRRDRVPAITHVDGTGRLQTVPEGGGIYRRLIEAFHRRTGVPMVLNTSFNVRGEPIVCGPAEAIQCFLSTDMDALVLGPYLVLRRDNREHRDVRSGPMALD